MGDMEIPDELIDQLLGQYQGPERLTGPDGLINQLRKRLIERAAGVELEQHLGYPPGAEPPEAQPNRRNGTTSKTLRTVDGPVTVELPRDRDPSAAQRHLARLVPVTHRDPIGVLLAPRAHDLDDFLFQQLDQHAEADADAQRQQPLSRRAHQLPERLLHALRQHDLLTARLRERYVASHGGSSFDLRRIAPNAPNRSGRGRRDRLRSSTSYGTTSAFSSRTGCRSGRCDRCHWTLFRGEAVRIGAWRSGSSGRLGTKR